MDQVSRRPEIAPEDGISKGKDDAIRRGLRVRLLESRDTDAVREVLKQHHAATVFRDQAFSDWKLNEHFKTVLSRPPRMVAPVAELDGRPVGIAWAAADSYMLSDGPLFVTVHVIAVDLTSG